MPKSKYRCYLRVDHVKLIMADDGTFWLVFQNETQWMIAPERARELQQNRPWVRIDHPQRLYDKNKDAPMEIMEEPRARPDPQLPMFQNFILLENQPSKHA